MRQVFDVPDCGDVIAIAATAGSPNRRGPAVRRTAVVLSPRSYNGKVGLAVVCPIRSSVTGYPFEVPLPPDFPVTGAILSDQVMSLDWRAHRSEKVGALPPEAVAEILGKLRALLA